MSESLRVCHIGARVVLTTMFLTACGGGGGGQAGPPPPTPSGSLVADAGPDQSGTDAQQIVVTGSATGSASAGAKYSWRQVSGTSGKVDNATSKSAAFFPPALMRDETFELELTVTDAQGGGANSDRVKIAVTASPVKSPFPVKAPDYLIARFGEDVVLDGSGSVGATGFSWRATPGFEPVALSNSNQEKATFKVPDSPAIRAAQFALQISDSQLQKNEDVTYVYFYPKNGSLSSDFETGNYRVPSPAARKGNYFFRIAPNEDLTNYPNLRLTGIVANTGSATLSDAVAKIRLNPSPGFKDVFTIDQFNLPSILVNGVLDIASVKKESSVPLSISGLHQLDFCVTSGSKAQCQYISSEPLKIVNGQLSCAEDQLEETWLGTEAPTLELQPITSSSRTYSLCNDASDRFSLNLEAGKNYRLRISSLTDLTSKSTTPLAVELLDPNGQVVSRGKAFANDYNLSLQTIDYKPAQAGIYRLRISKPQNFSDNVDYAVFFTQLDERTVNLVGASDAYLIDAGRTLVFDMLFGNEGNSDFNSSITRYIFVQGPIDMAARADTDYTGFSASTYSFADSIPAGSQKRMRVKLDIGQLGLLTGGYYVRSTSGFSGSVVTSADNFSLMTTGSPNPVMVQ